jgi:cytidine deaminase
LIAGIVVAMDPDTELIDKLVSAAASVRNNAHAPYSGYRVGAAVLTAKNEIFTGCNVENASYGLSSCAERNAVFAAVAGGAADFRMLVVVTDSSPPAAPCGACRQVLAEFGDIPVVLVNPAGEQLSTTVFALQPRPFLKNHLSTR